MRVPPAAVFFVLMGSLVSWVGAGIGEPYPQTLKPPLDTRVVHFELRELSLVDGLGLLSSEHIAGLHLGVEEVLRNKLSDPRDRSVRFTLTLENKTVREILDMLCQSDSRYVWSVDGASVNVYPRDTVNDARYFMNMPLREITFTDVKDPDHALTPLVGALPGQQIGYLQFGLGDNSYSEPWTTTFKGITVRQFANRIAEHMGPETSWIWQGGKDSRMFTFLKGAFHPH